MYLQANPGRGRSDQEKEELREKYKPGEQVLPKVESRDGDSADEEQRRMINEVREISLREVGVRGPRTYERGIRHRSRDSRRREDTQSRPHESDSRRRPGRPNVTPDGRSSGSEARRIEHQSSLRSIMSNSDIDSSEMEEEVLRLVNEGWLDGIDLSSLDVAQVDELSERIAEAYRRRHHHRPSSRDNRVEDSRRPRGSRVSPRTNSRDRPQTRRSRSSNATEHRHHVSHPPVSRPQLLEAYPVDRSHQRTSSEQRRQTSPVPRSSTSRISSGTQNQAVRSATDLSIISSSTPRSRPLELTNQGRRITDPDQGRSGETTRQISAPSSETNEYRQRNDNIQTPSQSSQAITRPTLPSRRSNPDQLGSSSRRSSSEVRRTQQSSSTDHLESGVSRSPISAVEGTQQKLFLEPSVRCDRCLKPEIQYDVHQHCSICRMGNYNLCIPCYRRGLGCLHWFGFGYAALQNYQRYVSHDGHQAPSDPPHIFVGHQYVRPHPQSINQSSGAQSRTMTTEDPSRRLLAGVFCSRCLTFANDCFWKCDLCNEGEWGFCSRCVNQGNCCTHSLIPIAHSSSLNAANEPSTTATREKSFVPSKNLRQASQFRSWGLPALGHFLPLTFSTNCAICRYPIQPSNTRFHCPKCNDGDYDICNNSYLKLVSSGRISNDNGDKGWRKCLNGHRMIVVGFEDSSTGQKRIVVKDLVGGHALQDDENRENKVNGQWSWQEGQDRQVRAVSTRVANSSDGQAVEAPLLRKYPPNGGAGMKVLALWSYWPQDGAQDELAFPKGAEIQEVEDINRDWFRGCYAGAVGLFPGNYVRVLEEVTS
ncbi:MAG: hypothetical protein LQ342_005484 [Letrouitia transgressa]|nr:MAG: hypothetical protein LQ342_005484 [Letrouitia transgressa]